MYRKIEAERAKSPGLTINAIAEKLGVNSSHYYNRIRAQKAKTAKKVAKKKTAPKARPYRRFKADALASPAPSTDDRLMVILGSPAQIRSVIAGVMA